MVDEPPNIWKMKPKIAKKPSNESAIPMPRITPKTMETMTMDRISNRTKRMICFGLRCRLPEGWQGPFDVD